VQHSRGQNFDLVITEAQDRVARKYITSMLQNNVLRRKISFTNDQERKTAAVKIKKEAMNIKTFFKEVAGGMADYDSPFDTLATLAEVLGSDDEMISLELGTVCKRYPDVSHEQIFCLLLLRGDLNRSDAKMMAGEYVSEVGSDKPLHAKSILSQVHVSSSLNPFN